MYLPNQLFAILIERNDFFIQRGSIALISFGYTRGELKIHESEPFKFSGLDPY